MTEIRLPQSREELAHAYIVPGDLLHTTGRLQQFLEESIGITCAGNPDVVMETYESFGVADSHELGRQQSARSVTGTGRFFIISVHTISSEAQNALLKILEEPTEGTHFFFAVPYMDMLLPTLRSRCAELQFSDMSQTVDDSAQEMAEAFLKGSTADRIKIVQSIIDEKTETTAEAFLDAVERSASRYTRTAPEFLTRLYALKKYIRHRGGSKKIALEELAATAPQI